jgi:hypothetical protein
MLLPRCCPPVAWDAFQAAADEVPACLPVLACLLACLLADVPLGANWMSGLARDALLSPEALALQLGGGAPQQEPDASACMAQCLGVLPDDLYPACQPASAKHQQQRDIWALSAATLAPAWDSRSSLDSGAAGGMC